MAGRYYRDITKRLLEDLDIELIYSGFSPFGDILRKRCSEGEPLGRDRSDKFRSVNREPGGFPQNLDSERTWPIVRQARACELHPKERLGVVVHSFGVGIIELKHFCDGDMRPQAKSGTDSGFGPSSYEFDIGNGVHTT